MKKTTPHSPKEDREAIRFAVRLFEDFQHQRKRLDNRLGRKADGTDQAIYEREFGDEDLAAFTAIADSFREQEEATAKQFKRIVRRFPIWKEFLAEVPGLGETTAAWMLSYIDIHKADTVSKLWQYCGYNPGMVRGKKRKELKDGKYELVVTDTMIRGDRMTPGFVAPFNKRLRTAMFVGAEGMVKAGIRSKPTDGFEPVETVGIDPETKEPGVLRRYVRGKYAKLYCDYKYRLSHSEQLTSEIVKGGDVKPVAWRETKLRHRDMAAKRYMMKHLLADLYAAWRPLEGLPVRAPYQEAYLGHRHAPVAK